MTTAIAPGKLILMGEHSVVYGHPCIVTAVNTCIKVSVEIGQPTFEIDAPQVNSTDYVEAMVHHFNRIHGIADFVSIKTEADVDDMKGLGSSSAVSVATCKALNDVYETNMSVRDIFDTSFHVVKGVQGSGSGADAAAAAYGGTLFYSGMGETIEPIDGSLLKLVIGNTGVKAPTKDLVQKVAEEKERNQDKVDSIFEDISVLVQEAKADIQSGNFEKLGEKMTKNHELLQKLDVSTDMLDSLVEAAIDAGAYGAKLSGAGGGDNMFALVSDDKAEAVKEAIEKTGGKVVNTKINYAP